MAKSSRVLALDIGAASIKLAEFAYGAGNSMTLLSFDHREYGEDLTEDTRGFVISSTLSDMLEDGHYESKKALISLSGQYALTRFVPLPPVAEEETRVRQIVEFEARQNVPFPMDEVIWDYQLISNPGADELEVMFVVIKNEIVEEITGAVQQAGLEPVLVDVAPVAAYNAARANGVGDDGCAMLLNLGARSTNLVFADQQQFFARTIPIAGHSISQQIAKEFSMGTEKAEELKRRHGFVALGGAYAEPESEVAASVSKIVRNVMTRLHGEINRSIGVYRAQQKGKKPTKLYLTGGSSTMGFTDRFFEDKLGLPVEYFNPFTCVQMGPGVDVARLQNIAHMFSEVVGLGLRYRSQCAVEVSLMPQTIVRQMAMARKKPYLLASAACFLLMMLIAWLAFAQKDKVYRELISKSTKFKEELESRRQQIERKISETDSELAAYKFLENFLKGRSDLPRVINTIESLKPNELWLTSIRPITEMTVAETAPMERDGRGYGGGFGFELPGGSAGFGEEVGGSSSSNEISIEKITISGFYLEGNSLALRDADLKILEKAPKQVGAAQPVPAPEPQPEIAPVAPAENALPFGAPPEGVPDVASAAPVEALDLKPAELLQKRLKDHPLFKADTTVFVTYTKVPEIQNMKKFKLQVVLENPIQIVFE